MTWATIRKAQPEDYERSEAAAIRFIDRHREELLPAGASGEGRYQEAPL